MRHGRTLGKTIRWLLPLVLVASCHPESAGKGSTPKRVRAQSTEVGAHLRAELGRCRVADDWMGYWRTLIRLCYAAPEAGEVRLPLLLPVLNHPEWTEGDGVLLEEKAGRKNRIAATLQAFSYLAAVGGPEQKSEAWLATAILLENTDESGKAMAVWRAALEQDPHSAAGRMAASRVWEAKHLRVGARLPTVRWKDSDGRPIDLGKLKEGTLVYFWSTSCAPCLVLIRKLRQFSDTGGAPPAMVGVNYDEKRTEFDESMRRLGPPGRQVFARDQSVRFDISAFPTTIVVTRGMITDIDPDLAKLFRARAGQEDEK